MPDINNPYVFYLWKGAKADVTLVRKTLNVVFKGDGRSYYFDISTGSVSREESANYDFTISLNSDRQKYEKVFDWAYSIEVNNGGLVEDIHPYPYEAPAEGYVPSASFEYSYDSNPKKWQNTDVRKFYIKSKTGKYSHINLTIRARGNNVTIKSVTNPSGSRNLTPP